MSQESGRISTYQTDPAMGFADSVIPYIKMLQLAGDLDLDTEEDRYASIIDDMAEAAVTAWIQDGEHRHTFKAPSPTEVPKVYSDLLNRTDIAPNSHEFGELIYAAKVSMADRHSTHHDQLKPEDFNYLEYEDADGKTIRIVALTRPPGRRNTTKQSY